MTRRKTKERGKPFPAYLLNFLWLGQLRGPHFFEQNPTMRGESPTQRGPHHEKAAKISQPSPQLARKPDAFRPAKRTHSTTGFFQTIRLPDRKHGKHKIILNRRPTQKTLHIQQPIPKPQRPRPLKRCEPAAF